MKKLLLTYAKKSMSLVLTVLMLMSCWVFMAPEHAHAAGLQYNVAGVTNYIAGKSSTATIKNADDGDNVDYVTLTYPSEIYLDKNETLQDVGYGITFSSHYGDSASDYRIHLMSGSWGGDSAGSQVTQMDKNATMRNAFTSYTFTVSGGTKSTKNGSGSVLISGGNSSGTIKLSGTPNAVGNYTFDNRYETNGTTAADPIMAFFQKINCSAWPEDTKLDKGDNNHLGYRSTGSNSGNVLIKVYIYDKAPLNTAISNANTIINNNNAYSAYLVGGNLATLTTEKNNGSTTLSTRAVTQSTVETRTTAINNAANALKFAASNANLLTAIQEANAVKAESDYSIKYTAATRTALETAIANATTNTGYDEGVTTYSVSISNSSTHSAGSKAAAEQTAINNLTTALTNAIDAMAIQGYTVKFLNYKNEEVSSKEYPYGTAASAVTVPALSTDPYDATNHFSYSWPTVNNVTGNATYTEIQSGTKHSLNYKDQTNTHHTVYCLYCNYTAEVAHTPANGKSTPHTCDAAGYITYQCSVCGHTYTKDGYILDVNGNEVADPAAHGSTEVAKYDDNQHGNKCSVCGEFVGELSNHSWTLADTDITKAPTCNEEGEGIYRCSCGATKTDSIAKDPDAHSYSTATPNGDGTHTAVCENGCGTDVKDDCVDKDNNCVCDVCGYSIPHVYENKVIAANLVSAADCNSYAVYYKSCKCGDVSEETFEDINGGYGAHNWDDTEKYLKSAAECEIDAVYYYECLECGVSSATADGSTWTKTGSALKHNYTANADKSNIVDNDNGTHSYTCRNGCGKVGGEVACNYGGYTYDSTNHYRTCADCGYVETTAHTMTNWVSDNESGATAGTQSRECTVCDYAETQQNCNYAEDTDAYVAPTCMTLGGRTYICSDCGHGYSVVLQKDPANHTGNNHFENGYDATCSATGYEGDIICECGVKVGDGATLPEDPDNHVNTEVINESEENCKYDGYTGDTYCNDCQQTIIKGEVIPATGVHTWDNGEVTTAPACEATGIRTFTCSVCGDTKTEVEPATGHNYTGDAVKADGDVHAYECANDCGTTGIGTEKGKTEACSGGTASCTELAECEVCGDTWGELAAHVFTGEYAQYTVDGVEYHNQKCANCDAYGLGSEKDAKEACSGGEATCLDKAECSACGNEYGTALGHTFEGEVVELENNEHTYKCVRCDVTGTVAGGEGGTEACVDSDPEVIDPTCTTAGYTQHECDICDNEWTTDPVDALGHDYTERLTDEAHWISDADCETDEVYWYDCSRCDKNAKDEEDTDKYTELTFVNTPALGHKFDGSIEYLYLASEATCTANETYYVYCSVCEESSEGTDEEATFVKYGTMLPHPYAEIVDEEDLSKNRKSEATCTESAVYYKSCSVCGEQGTETFSYGDPLDHNFKEKVMDNAHKITDANCVTAATYYYDCTRCAYNASLVDTTGWTDEAVAALKYTDGGIDENNHTELVDVAFKAATCTEDGHSAYKHCNGCGDDIDKVTEGYEATGHNFTGAYKYYEVEGKADSHNRKCTKCDAYGIGTGEDATEDATVECEFGEWAQVADTGTHSRSCVCGNTETEECSGGTATCTEQAVCGTCGGKYGEPTGHDTEGVDWTSNGDDTHSIICKNCNTAIDTQACSGGEATCKEKAVCEVCETEYGETTDHSYGEYTVIKEATCYEAAVEKAVCAVCGAETTRTTGTPLSHKLGDWVITTEPNCKDEGVQTMYCQNTWKDENGEEVKCDHSISQVIPADKTKHVASDWIQSTTAGDCTTGIKYYKECTVCGTKLEEKTETGMHQWKQTIHSKPTCITDGFINYVCEKCGFTKTEWPEDLKAKGSHTWSTEITDALTQYTQWIDTDKDGVRDAEEYYTVNATKQPSCANKGRGYMVCTECGEHSENVEIDKCPHGPEADLADDGELNNTLIIDPVEPGCDTKGHNGYWNCLNCSYSSSESDEYVEYAPLGHNDADGDGKCDDCRGQIYDNDGDNDIDGSCSCMCHNDSWLMQLFYKIFRFFWKLFRINQSCSCGFEHY